MALEFTVKLLDGLSQIKKSFLAEVETIGRTHHLNLVRLIGFCVENFISFLFMNTCLMGL